MIKWSCVTDVEVLSFEQQCFRLLHKIIRVINTNALRDEPIIIMFLGVNVASAGGTLKNYYCLSTILRIFFTCEFRQEMFIQFFICGFAETVSLHKNFINQVMPPLEKKTSSIWAKNYLCVLEIVRTTLKYGFFKFPGLSVCLAKNFEKKLFVTLFEA